MVGTWIKVSLVGRDGYCYLRPSLVDRVIVVKKPDAEQFHVTVATQRGDFLYGTYATQDLADVAARELSDELGD